jgi:Chaperone of endosialidase
MKKIILFMVLAIACIQGFAQAPQQINYQGVARNSVGNALVNQSIRVRLSVRDATPTGPVVYTETRTATTNLFGLFTIAIGSTGATNVTGTVAAINWAVGSKFLQVEMDPNGGTTFINAGTTQLQSVPYSLFAASALPVGPAGGSLTGTYPNPTVANGAITQAMIAPGVTLPPSGPAGGDLTGTYPNPTLAASGVAAGAYGNAANYSTFTVDAKGRLTTAGQLPLPTSLPPSGPAGGDLSGTYPNPNVARLQGRPVSAAAPINTDVLSWNGANWTPASVASLGAVTGNGTLNFLPKWTPSGTVLGNSRVFDNGTSVGIGTTSPITDFHLRSTTSWPAAFEATTAQSYISIHANGNYNGYFGTWNNAANRDIDIGTGAGNTTGKLNFATQANVMATITPTGFMGINKTSPTAMLHIKGNSNGFNGGIRLEDDGSTEFGDILNGQEGLIYFTQSAGNDHLFLTNTFASVANPAMIIKENGNVGFGVSTTPTANIDVNGQVRIRGGAPGAGKFLVSDATGTGSWVTVAPGGVGGGGTLNFIPKWTPNGITLGNSLLFDDGTSVGLGTTTPSSQFKLDVSPATGTARLLTKSATGDAGFWADKKAASDRSFLVFRTAGADSWSWGTESDENLRLHNWTTANDNAIFVEKATDNIGINTGTPSYKLDVVHGGSTGIHNKSTAGFSVFDIDAFSGDAAIRFANNGVNQWNLRNQPGTDDLQIFELGGGGERMAIKNGTGNVAIGASTGAYRLDILHGGSTGILNKSSAGFSVFDIDAFSGDAAIRFANNGVNQWNLRNQPGTDDLQIFELGGGGERMAIKNTTGNVAIGGSTGAYRLDILHGGSTGILNKSSAGFSVFDIDAFSGDAAIRFANNGVNQWNLRNQPGTDNLQIFELGGGGERMSIQNTTGNVAIGGSTGAYRLDVLHGGSTGILNKSSASFSVLDIDAFSGDAAIRLANNGVNQWNIRNQPGTNNLQVFELGGGGERMILENTSGRMGVNNPTPLARVDVGGVTGGLSEGLGITNKSITSTWFLYSSASGNMFIGKAGNLGVFDGVSGAYTAVSDGRLKTNIKPLESVLSKIMSLDAKRYEYKVNANGQQNIGFIAQEIQKEFPEFVRVNKNDEGNPLVENQLSMDYSGLSVVAIKAIQEQQEMLNAMGNVANGNVVTNTSGKAIVTLKPNFVNDCIDFKYQLTVVDATQFAQVRISKKITANSFEIATDKPGIEISWQVTGVRKSTNNIAKIDLSAEYTNVNLEAEAAKLKAKQNALQAANAQKAAAIEKGGSLDDVAIPVVAAKLADNTTGTVSEEANQPRTTTKVVVDNTGTVADENNKPAAKIAAKATALTGTVADEVIKPVATPAAKAVKNGGTTSDEVIIPATKPVEKTTNNKVAAEPVKTDVKPAANATGSGAKSADAPKANTKAVASSTQKSTGE